MESAQIPVCVAANMVGVALVLPIVGDDAPFLEETTTPQLWLMPLKQTKLDFQFI